MAQKIMTDRCQRLKRDCLIRIRDLRALLDTVELQVKNDEGVLNDLGELQGMPVLLDCRLASLSVARSVRASIQKALASCATGILEE